MKNITNSIVIGAALMMSALNAQADTQLDAFPGAEGAGRYTTGGRGGVVYHVTSLEDDASTVGTLRYAVNQVGARTIVFDVAGIIELKSGLNIKNGNLTIAGQTAPGDGICLKNYTLEVSADNVIIRYIRSRMGDEQGSEDDAMWGRNHSNIIIDHCTMSWSVDECSSFYNNHNMTMQWCILSESLYHSKHEKGNHGYCGIWGGEPATFHHNLIAHHTSRNPRLCGARFNNDAANEMVDIRNNVFYNFGPVNSGYAGEGGVYNFINNYYKPGPVTATKDILCYRIFQANADDGTNQQSAGVWGTFHFSGNYFDMTCDKLSSSQIANGERVNADNWVGLHVNTGNGGMPGGSKTGIESSKAFECKSVTTHSAADAFAKVLEYAGASKSRDDIDARIVTEVENGTYTYSGPYMNYPGIIDSQENVGGWPAYTCTTTESKRMVDSDGDGIPDYYEDLLSLDPNDGTDGNKTTLSSEGYTNLEYYLNILVKTITNSQLEGGTASEAPSGDSNSNVDAFMATTDSNGAYGYYWFNADNAAEVNRWISDGTITLDANGSKFSTTFTNTNYSDKVGALQLKASVGEAIFKCPGVSTFKLYMLRTGSYKGTVSVSSDGKTFTDVTSITGATGILELDLSSAVASANEVYVKIANGSTGTLNIYGIEILSPKSTSGVESVLSNTQVSYTKEAIVAANAMNIRVYALDGTCVASAVGTELSIEPLSAGIYVSRVVTTDGKMIVNKFVK